jgi:hypothetical protein
MIIIGLIEEYVFPIFDALIIGGKFFENSVWTDSVFFAELLPKLGPNYVSSRVL